MRLLPKPSWLPCSGGWWLRFNLFIHLFRRANFSTVGKSPLNDGAAKLRDRREQMTIELRPQGNLPLIPRVKF
jgi:hypothetical protein